MKDNLKKNKGKTNKIQNSNITEKVSKKSGLENKVSIKDILNIHSKISYLVILLVLLVISFVITKLSKPTQIQSLKAEETQDERVVWYETTEADGSKKRVPVPKGYSASRVDGENTVNGGFVIYEGDDSIWDGVFVNSTSTTNEEKTTNNTNNVGLYIYNDKKETTNTKENTKDSKNSEDKINNENLTNNEINKETTINNDTDVKVYDDKEEVNSLKNVAELADNNTDESTLTDEEQTRINIFNLQKSVNQWVWVPVDENEIKNIYGVDENGKIWGKLWNFPSSDTGTRTPLNWSETNGVMNISNVTEGNREPDVTSNMTNTDIDENSFNYLDGKTRYELAEELNTLYLNAIKSIKKYGGFYIGRYETGDLNKDVPVVRKMNTDITNKTWYKVYNKSKRLSNGNENVTTSMVFGSLFDQTLEWLVESGAKNSQGQNITYSKISRYPTSWGNYWYSEINYIPANATIPDATSITEPRSYTRIPTGSSEYTKVNNIYDIAGNVWKWTIEANSRSSRVMRAGSCIYYGGIYPSFDSVSNRPPNQYSDNARFCGSTLHKLNNVSLSPCILLRAL